MIKWEYLVVEDEQSLARLGEKGWELVAVIDRKEKGLKFYLKKPAPGLSERVTEEQRRMVYQQCQQGDRTP